MRKRIEVLCDLCQKPFFALPDERKRGWGRYCSRSCSGKANSKFSTPEFINARNQQGDRNPNWKGGRSFDLTTRRRRWRANNPEKYAAQRLLTHAIKKGVLIPMPCEVCGSEKTEGHHWDYSKPLDVRWLCKTHHLEAHGGRFGTNNLPIRFKS
jgi:hypothetical protein